MTIETLKSSMGESTELGGEVITNPHEIAELGSIKPKEYGSLMRKKLAKQFDARQIEPLSRSEMFSDGDLFGYESAYSKFDESRIGAILEYSPEETAEEIADSLYDSGVTLKNWESASLPQRQQMLETAADIMERGMEIPAGAPDSVTPGANWFLLPKSDFAEAMAEMYFGKIKIKLQNIVRKRQLGVFSSNPSRNGFSDAGCNFLDDSEAYVQTANFKSTLSSKF